MFSFAGNDRCNLLCIFLIASGFQKIMENTDSKASKFSNLFSCFTTSLFFFFLIFENITQYLDIKIGRKIESKGGISLRDNYVREM